MEIIEYKYPTEMILGQEFMLMQQEHHILKQRRLELDLTQNQVAEMAGILPRQYLRIESGERTFSMTSSRIMLAVCAVLRLDPYLFFPEVKQAPLPKKPDVVTIPAKPSRFISFDEYCNLISRVPYGKLTTSKLVEDYFKKKYDVEVVVIDYHGKGFAEFQEEIPLWRELSQKGQLYATTRLHSRDRQQELLEGEGHTIVECGRNGVSRKVLNYRDCLFNFEEI